MKRRTLRRKHREAFAWLNKQMPKYCMNMSLYQWCLSSLWGSTSGHPVRMAIGAYYSRRVESEHRK